MDKLRKYKFNELYTMSSGISSKPEQAGHGCPFVSFSTVFNNYFLPDALNELMDTSEQEQEKYSIQKGDILLTRTSETIDELGMSCVALKDYPRATFSGFVKRLRPTQKDITYEKYMGFYLRNKFFRKIMTNNAFITLRASLNEAIFSYINLYLPDYQTQVKIGDFLHLLNKKIDLNQRINAELESMAKTLYDYWFVQFDFPDKNGKPYRSSGGKMVWNEDLKRDIPFGWEVGNLELEFEVKKGDLITEKTKEIGTVKVIAGGIDFAYYHSISNREENTITVSGSGANAGYVNFWREKIYASDCTTVRGKSDIETIIAFYYLKLIQNQIYRYSQGSAQPHVYPTDIKKLPYVYAPREICGLIEPLVIPLNQKITNNLIENQELAELRDWLLPMLMNGQVKVA